MERSDPGLLFGSGRDNRDHELEVEVPHSDPGLAVRVGGQLRSRACILGLLSGRGPLRSRACS